MKLYRVIVAGLVGVFVYADLAQAACLTTTYLYNGSVSYEDLFLPDGKGCVLAMEDCYKRLRAQNNFDPNIPKILQNARFWTT